MPSNVPTVWVEMCGGVTATYVSRRVYTESDTTRRRQFYADAAPLSEPATSEDVAGGSLLLCPEERFEGLGVRVVLQLGLHLGHVVEAQDVGDAVVIGACRARALRKNIWTRNRKKGSTPRQFCHGMVVPGDEVDHGVGKRRLGGNFWGSG